MRKWIGRICIFLGVICLVASVGFITYNQWEDKKAEENIKSLLESVQGIVDEEQQTPSLSEDKENMPTEMKTVKVDGYECIGILTIPALEIELPVLTDWSYAKLKKAPCHYYGTYFEKDFIIAAHNYRTHFGRLSELQSGDVVIFSDVNGMIYYYEVILLETLPGNATEEMLTGGFDLTLYTCTPGGGSRITVRCNAMKI